MCKCDGSNCLAEVNGGDFDDDGWKNLTLTDGFGEVTTSWRLCPDCIALFGGIVDLGLDEEVECSRPDEMPALRVDVEMGGLSAMIEGRG